MQVRFGVVVFPGSNCDHDAYHVVSKVIGEDARFIWHKEETIGDVDVVILPGGFSYGDYLRSGAIARFSPVMKDVTRFAADGGLVLGICNGFQVLCESGLLPGGLMRNRSLRFICKKVNLRVENVGTSFTTGYDPGEVVSMSIAHGEGCYYASDEILDELESTGRVVFRYCDSGGGVTPGSNPNGSVRNIAGIVNAAGNVLGMMPHPERAAEPLMGSTDGLRLFESVVSRFRTEAFASIEES